MTSERYAELIEAADRLWAASWSLDEQRGDTVATAWTAEHVRRLIRYGGANDPFEVLKLATALERRLQRVAA